MKNNYLLHTRAAKKLYKYIADMPIIDYHCHLSAKEIYDDAPFCDIGEMWLKSDHYKWRLMRSAGIDERYITGDDSYKDKFMMYSSAVAQAPGNPLYDWTKMELDMYFGITKPLCPESAKEIYEQANAYIKCHSLSPRRLIMQSNVRYIATTDDVADSLEYHEKLKDENCSFTVAPSFRTDNLLLCAKDGYADYIARLSEISGINITDIASLKTAVSSRLDRFVALGCKMTDVGIMYFPDAADFAVSEQDADNIFKSALRGDCDMVAQSKFIAYMFIYLAALYRERGLIMQWHLGAHRNANTSLYKTVGADCGADVVGCVPSTADLAAALDIINENGGLPRTIIYVLDSAAAPRIASVCYAYHGVSLGCAWWFADTRRGNIEQIKTICENSAIGTFPGMLTDSRSFLSYARHDYFRRLFADEIGQYVSDGELDLNTAMGICRAVACENAAKMTEVKL